VNNFNAKILQQIQRNIIVFNSVNTADINDAEMSHNKLTIKYLQNLSLSNLSFIKLYLKIKAFIILL